MKTRRSYIRIVLGVILPLGILLAAITYVLIPRPALSQSGSSLTGWISNRFKRFANRRY